jgi:outer membrane protein TolC
VAGQDVAIAQYNAAVLGAVREAADALSAIETNQRATAQQQVIEQGLADTVRLDEARVRAGLSARLDILDAQDRELVAAQRLADLRVDGALARIQLIVALGGGFPSPSGDAGPRSPCGDRPWTWNSRRHRLRASAAFWP